MHTIYETIYKEQLGGYIRKFMKEARENNLDLIIREMSEENDRITLVVDLQVKLPFEISGLKSAEQIVEKLEELEGKKNYWVELANAESGKREEDYKYYEQVSYFEGAINALKFVLKKNEL